MREPVDDTRWYFVKIVAGGPVYFTVTNGEKETHNVHVSKLRAMWRVGGYVANYEDAGNPARKYGQITHIEKRESKTFNTIRFYMNIAYKDGSNSSTREFHQCKPYHHAELQPPSSDSPPRPSSDSVGPTLI